MEEARLSYLPFFPRTVPSFLSQLSNSFHNLISTSVNTSVLRHQASAYDNYHIIAVKLWYLNSWGNWTHKLWEVGDLFRRAIRLIPHIKNRDEHRRWKMTDYGVR
jgi:hypothetical protein